MKPRLTRFLQILAVLAGGCWAFWPALSGGWIWDDGAEILRNAPIRQSFAAFGRIWWAPSGADYFPLKESFQWVEWHLWGDHPLGYHLASLALHLLSAFLFWRILTLLGVRLAWFGALLLAIHPQMVESVAWIAELKNTLSLPLLLGAFLAYLRAESRRTPGRSGAGDYVLSLGLFAAAALAKSSVVMFPVGLLLYVWWRDGKVSGLDLRRVIAFFGVSLVLGLVTVWYQSHRSITGGVVIPGTLDSRLAVAGWAFWFYLAKFIAPFGLTPIYLVWTPSLASVSGFLPWLGIVLLGILGWMKRMGWGKTLLFGLGWYAINLFPVSGVIPMAFSRLGSVSDHFVYLSLLGPIGLVAGGLGALSLRIAARGRVLWLASCGVVVGLVLVLAQTSRSLAGIYSTDETFWTYAAKQNSRAWIARNNLGLIFTQGGHLSEAVAQFEQVIATGQDVAEVHNNLGNAYAGLGRFAEAAAQFQAALRVQPNFLDAEINLGNARVQAGDLTGAASAYEAAVQLNPGVARGHLYLGIALAQLGRSAEAMAQFNEALRIEPSLAEAHYRLANLEANAGAMPQAIAGYTQAVTLKPDYAEAYANLGLAYAVTQQPQAGLQPLSEAIRLQPNSAESRAYLGFVLNALHRYAEAVAQYREAERLGGNDADLHYNLADSLRALGHFDEARTELELAKARQSAR